MTCRTRPSFTKRTAALAGSAFASLAFATIALAADPSSSSPTSLDSNDVVLRAMVDELNRSAAKLHLADLDKPYFIQFKARERHTYSMGGDYGGLVRTDDRRTRDFTSRIRVGAMDLDNTNFGRPAGRAGPLPLDDDYAALRHAMWLTADADYKQAVETITAKRAFLKDTHVEDRPDDFTSVSPTLELEPRANFSFDRAEWERRVEALSARFKNFPRIQQSNVTLIAGDATEWTVNTEGTRLRTSDTGLFLRLSAETQAADGMRLADSKMYLAETLDQWPSMETLAAGVDELCRRLIALADAPTLDHYSGPVLFEPVAAGQVFAAMLGDNLCARPAPLGTGGVRDEGFEKKIGLRILPRTFHLHDDPREELFQGTVLAGAYKFDDEAVPATEVDLVKKGILQTLLAGRAPTRKVKASTGHARSDSFADSRASLGCLYVSDDAAVSDDELRKELLQAARDEGLEYALRVTAIEGGGNSLGAPIYAYKVFVEDGREELVRGLKFLPTETRSLKRLLAAGTKREVYNDISGVSASVISPAILFEELELTKAQEEFDKPPILKPPTLR